MTVMQFTEVEWARLSVTDQRDIIRAALVCKRAELEQLEAEVAEYERQVAAWESSEK